MTKKRLFKYITIIIGLIAIIYIYKISKLHFCFGRVNIRSLKRFIGSYGKYSAIVLLIIYAVKPFVMLFPTWVLGVVSGVLYGWFWGYIVSLLGCFVSATVGYYVAKFLGKDFVHKITKGKLDKFDKVLEKDGFKILFLMRLPVIFPYDALSLACGLTSIRFRDFILASVLGVMPEMFAYNYFGNSFNTRHYKSLLIPITIIIILLVVSFIIKDMKEME
ncbi:MAG: TVP38/TMEM64 family protein [Caloramator sp.]|nr:TVP38/TMEM64 family protein [Caloramator sp.]